jgi:hypothetical protein
MVVFGSFTKISGIDHYDIEYENNQWRKAEALKPQIAFDGVLATQSLVMQLLKRQQRSVLRGDKRHGFAAINSIHSDQDQFYDDSTEEYLACRIAKKEHDQWRMRIRFRENHLSEAEKDVSYFDDYSFDWLRNGNLQAWYGSYTVASGDTGTYEQWQGIAPINESMLTELHYRINKHMLSATISEVLRIERQRANNI